MELIYTLILFAVVGAVLLFLRHHSRRQSVSAHAAASPRRVARMEMAQGDSMRRTPQPVHAPARELQTAESTPLKVIVSKSAVKYYDPTPIFSALAAQFESRGVVMA